jgi:hypothetical protein
VSAAGPESDAASASSDPSLLRRLSGDRFRAQAEETVRVGGPDEAPDTSATQALGLVSSQRVYTGAVQ